VSAEHVTIGITVIAALALTVLSGIFLLLSLAGRVLTDNDDRSPLGAALGHVSGATGILLLSFAGFLMLRLSVGPKAPLEPEWLNTTLRVTLTASAVWCVISGLFVLPRLLQRFRNRPGDIYEINQAAVFGALGQSLPIIVSNHEGTIQHTTAEFDALVGTVPGDLIGKQLETIMPERYHAGHDHGMKRYIETREPHIIGTVVAIDMLRRDGVEIPVYLALNTTDVDGKPWFVASIWPKPQVVPETLGPTVADQYEGVNVRQDVRETEQNVREVFQDQRATVQDQRATVQDQRQATADERQATADGRDVTADARDVTACARDVTADERDAKENI